VGFVVDKMAPGQVFSEYFGFPCQPHFIPPTSPSSQTPGTGKIGKYMAAVPRGTSMDSTAHNSNKKRNYATACPQNITVHDEMWVLLSSAVNKTYKGTRGNSKLREYSRSSCEDQNIEDRGEEKKMITEKEKVKNNKIMGYGQNRQDGEKEKYKREKKSSRLKIS
jgi:hypothetical protein